MVRGRNHPTSNGDMDNFNRFWPPLWDYPIRDMDRGGVEHWRIILRNADRHIGNIVLGILSPRFQL